MIIQNFKGISKVNGHSKVNRRDSWMTSFQQDRPISCPKSVQSGHFVGQFLLFEALILKLKTVHFRRLSNLSLFSRWVSFLSFTLTLFDFRPVYWSVWFSGKFERSWKLYNDKIFHIFVSIFFYFLKYFAQFWFKTI